MIPMNCSEGCGQDFVLISYGKEQVKHGVDRVGFSCPHCEKVYTAYYSNRIVEKLHDQLAELQQRPAKGGMTRRQVQGISIRIKNTKKKLATEMARLRKEVEESQTSGNS
ncbi:hypothetical protein ABIE27_004082 [Paenibacillus sp. 4624]|uniref:hypothetical protein n=1 Tax=Paenibacillus sp. 4624 TaxID=3156453 RepID=UPI003D1C767C